MHLDDDLCEWVQLALRLREACPEKFADVVTSLTAVVEAQEIIARFDWQLLFRGRPRKRYMA